MLFITVLPLRPRKKYAHHVCTMSRCLLLPRFWYSLLCARESGPQPFSSGESASATDTARSYFHLDYAFSAPPPRSHLHLVRCRGVRRGVRLLWDW